MSAKSSLVLGLGLGSLAAMVVGVPLVTAATTFYYEHWYLPRIAGPEGDED